MHIFYVAIKEICATTPIQLENKSKFTNTNKIIIIQINSANLKQYMVLFYWNYIADVGFNI